MTRRTITTDATGRRVERPERAMVEVTAVGHATSAAGARADARDLAATVRESLTDEVVSPDRVETVDLEVEDAAQAFDPGTDAPYRAVERLRVECAPETAGEVAVVATDAGGTVPTVEFGLREETRRRLEDEALDAAMARARAKAERVAASEGLTVGDVREVTTDATGSGMSDIVDEALGARGDLELHPEPIAVTESVEAVYELVEE